MPPFRFDDKGCRNLCRRCFYCKKYFLEKCQLPVPVLTSLKRKQLKTITSFIISWKTHPIWTKTFEIQRQSEVECLINYVIFPFSLYDQKHDIFFQVPQFRGIGFLQIHSHAEKKTLLAQFRRSKHLLGKH